MKKRNVGLDLLRILAMFMVVLIHVNNYGELLLNKFFSLEFLPIYLFESFGIIAVNCFVLISGFFLVKQEFRLKKLVSLILEVLFYSWLFLLIAFLVGFPIDLMTFIKNLFPITFGTCWFASCYIMLYILFPFINKFINSLTLNQKNTFAFVTILIFCMWAISPFINKKTSLYGYSILWLCVLYYWGGYIRTVFVDGQHKALFKKLLRLSGYGYVVFTLVTVLFCVLLNIIGQTVWYALNFNAVVVFFASICLFIFMYKINIKENNFINKLIIYFSPATFGVYLISCNEIFIKYQKILLDKEFFMQSFNMPLMVLICAVCIFSICLLISSLFHKRIFEFSDKYIYPLVEKVYIYIDKKLFGNN